MTAKKVKTSEFAVQLLATICISFLASETAFFFSWPSYNIALLKSNATVLSMPMTSTHISLLGSISNVGCLIITPFCSYAFNVFGRKYATVLFGLPYVLAWAIISVSSNVYVVLFAMALVGTGMAGQSVAGIYISEISHDSVRGGLTAFPSFAYYVGLLVSNFLGGVLSYTQVVYTFLVLSVLVIVLLLLLKESPVYLVLAGREKEAAQSISFYRRLDVTSKEVEAEISIIKQQLNLELSSERHPDAPESGNALITAKESNQTRKQISSWSFLKKSKSSQRAFIMIFTLLAFTSMMGPMMFQVYAEPIFKEAAPSLDANQCAVGEAVAFIIASLVCVLAVDRCGRRTLLIYTAISCGICALLLGTLIQFHWGPEWMIPLVIYVYCSAYTMGCGTIPSVLMAEVFLPEVRSFCNSITMASLWLFSFIVLETFYPLVECMGLGPVFYLSSTICFVFAIYSKFYVPETKGMSVAEIQKLFVKD